MKKAVPVTKIPKGKFMVPRLHQKEAIERFMNEEVMALFFEMGCGKSYTLLAIAEAKYRKGEIEGLLVIAPNDVHRQWYDELVNGTAAGEEMTCPFEAQCFGGRGGQDEIYPFEEGKFWFLSVNVDTFSTKDKWRKVTEWANKHRIMIAIDEATVIKNPKSLRSQRILYEFNNTTRKYKRVITSEKINPCRAVLTGTPVTNGPVDLWSIMEFLEPGFFRMNYWAFREYFAMFTQVSVRGAGGGEREVSIMLNEKSWKAIKGCSLYEEARRKFGISEDTWRVISRQTEFSGPYKHADELKEMLAPVSAFKLLTDCVDMPETNYIVKQVGMSVEQEKAYKKIYKDLSVEFEGAYTQAQNMLVLYLRLQQISSGFLVNMEDKSAEGFSWDDEGYDLAPGDVVWIGESNPKLEALMQDIDECAKPLLIMTRYTAEAAKIYEMCKDKYRTGLFTGWKTVGGTEALKNGEIDILVANSQKICRGFNLQMAHTTLFYSNTFSMEVRQQAEFRTFRMGQKHPCLYVDYVASPVEQKIMDSLKMKKNLLDYIRDQDRDIVLKELA